MKKIKLGCLPAKKGSLGEYVQREITTAVLVWIIYPQLIFKNI